MVRYYVGLLLIGHTILSHLLDSSGHQTDLLLLAAAWELVLLEDLLAEEKRQMCY
jgi:hypothetical protein